MNKNDYNNKMRGKFSVSVTLDLVIDTLDPGAGGFAQAVALIAEKCRIASMEHRFGWCAELDAARIVKVAYQELAVPALVEIEEVVE